MRPSSASYVLSSSAEETGNLHDFEYAVSKDGDNDDADTTYQVRDWETGEDGQVGVSVQHGGAQQHHHI